MPREAALWLATCSFGPLFQLDKRLDLIGLLCLAMVKRLLYYRQRIGPAAGLLRLPLHTSGRVYLLYHRWDCWEFAANSFRWSGRSMHPLSVVGSGVGKSNFVSFLWKRNPPRQPLPSYLPDVSMFRVPRPSRIAILEPFQAPSGIKGVAGHSSSFTLPNGTHPKSRRHGSRNVPVTQSSQAEAMPGLFEPVSCEKFIVVNSFIIGSYVCLIYP